jgi:transcriptional regulator with XRE-family HTH domain
MSRKKSHTDKIICITPEEFKKIRNISGLNQEDFGESIGISQNSVSDYENRKTEIPKTVQLLIRYRYLKEGNERSENFDWLYEEEHKSSIIEMAGLIDFCKRMEKARLTIRRMIDELVSHSERERE